LVRLISEPRCAATAAPSRFKNRPATRNWGLSSFTRLLAMRNRILLASFTWVFHGGIH